MNASPVLPSRTDYLKLPHVEAFSEWLISKLDQPGSFEHSYYRENEENPWSCVSLFDAYEKYRWPFDFECPVLGNKVTGEHGQKSSFEYLTSLAEIMRDAIDKDDVVLTRNCALAVLEWGGVLKKNQHRIMTLGRGICKHFNEIRSKLQLDLVRLGEHKDIHINSGLTKIYFLLIDNFVMYDGRVGAALGLLARMFSEEKDLGSVPEEIKFSFGRTQEAPSGMTGPNRRNPSKGQYKLPEFTGDRQRHLDDNIKACWLLKNVADREISRFAELPQGRPLNERLAAMEAALFMIGYDVNPREN